MMSSVDILLKLLRIAIGNESDYSLPSFVDWKEVIDLSVEQGVAAIAVDGLQKIYDSDPDIQLDLDKPELEDMKYEWFGYTFSTEYDYEKHLKAIGKLAGLYGREGIKMMVLKGYASSLMYPMPSHRSAGDIDLYLYGGGERGDVLIKQRGIKVKQNEDKHSTFKFDDISVENHASFLNVVEYPSYQVVEDVLRREAMAGTSVSIAGEEVYLPTPMMNALFLSAHLAGHFVYGGASLKQVLDWAVFVEKHGSSVDFEQVCNLADRAGYGKFLRCLNKIVSARFNVAVPHCEVSTELVERVWNEIISPDFRKVGKGVFDKVLRFFGSRWRYDLVYRENFCLTFFRRSWASFRGRHLNDSRNVWE